MLGVADTLGAGEVLEAGYVVAGAGVLGAGETDVVAAAGMLGVVVAAAVIWPDGYGAGVPGEIVCTDAARCPVEVSWAWAGAPVSTKPAVADAPTIPAITAAAASGRQRRPDRCWSSRGRGWLGAGTGPATVAGASITRALATRALGT